MTEYLPQIIFSGISIIIIYALTYISTKSISIGGSMKLFLGLVISVGIAVIITTVFKEQIQDFVTIKLGLENYTLWKTILESLMIGLIGLIIIKSYFTSLWGLLLVCIFYFITVFWITPALYKLYNLMIYLIDRFL